MNRNLVEIALQELGAEDRALLELSVVRKVSDQDIAELLDVDIAHVLIKREEALGRVSALIGDDPEHILRTMRGLPTARWRDGQRETDHEPEPEVQPEPEVEPTPEPEPTPDPTPEPEPEVDPTPEPEPSPAPPEPWAPADRSRFMLALLGGLAITLVVVVVLALNGDEDDPVPAPSTSTSAQQRAPDGATALEPLVGSDAAGDARIRAGRLELDVRGLPDPARGGYVIWLYNSVTDARAVAGTRQGNFRLRPRLPQNFRRYRFVDVSREPSDGNPNHSGQSVVRVSVSEAAGG